MAPNAPTKVFIVDDSAIVRERLIALLAELPNVEIAGEAARASDAIAGIREHSPDVVVLDVSMPGGSGIRVLETIKKEPRSPLTIMLTNLDQPQYRQRCLKLGADYFIDKSSNFQQVIEIVRDFVPPTPPTNRPLSAPNGSATT
jgi:DNA-binding NarL/FixJ family response regulator